jgi:hypothetical protein
VGHACAVKHTCLATHSVCRESCDFLHVVGHQVKRVRDHDDCCIRSMISNTFTNLLNNSCILSNQVFASHSRLAWESGCHDDHFSTSDVLVVGRASNSAVVIQNLSILRHVESLALCKSFIDVKHDNIGNFHLSQNKCACCANISCSNHCNFFSVTRHSCPFVVSSSERTSIRNMVENQAQ